MIVADERQILMEPHLVQNKPSNQTDVFRQLRHGLPHKY